ncbi:choline dehydrogenase [Sphingobium sp. B2D3A]|uniref:GMC family oxidoreductase n=1 Tax=unclassified Sphingobium TaxID=2611147 RepID=UPI00222594A5|nr:MULTISPECIES: GMC family oxidoreductase N-terminal domain-containing protein [unclassified Sphingobium]MCW2337202.1 choline dehydrogenase [Sphingobium sp. B2D3A]MCW2383660.1 choline dehydrogenase [Sphingobium sp. B2D3D]
MDRFDYIVVGAGSAGCVLAARLSEDPRNRVLLLEAGGSDRRLDVRLPLAVSKLWPNPALTWGFMSEPEAELDGRRLPVARGRMLGGTSSLNGMMAIRGHKADYDGWRDTGLTDWGWDDVLPWFRKLERHWRGDTPEHGGSGPLSVEPHPAPSPLMANVLEAARSLGYPITEDFNGPRTDGFGMPDFTTRNGRRANTSEAYLRPALGRPNLEVRTGAVATRVLLRDGRAIGIEVSRDGRREEILAEREVLLAGGAINAPQLLLLSGIGPGAHLQEMGLDVAVESGEVGAHLQDHPGAGMEFDLDPALAFDRELRFDRLTGSFLRWVAGRKSIMGAPPLAASANVATGADPDVIDMHFLLIPLSMFSRVWFPGVARPFGPRMGAMWSLNYPKSRGWLKLGSPDPLAHPRIAFNLMSDPEDQRAMLGGYRGLEALIRQPALAKVVGQMRRPERPLLSDEEVMAYIRETAATAYHPSGTCRMGSDAQAVVDGRLRVNGVDGLRVVDASIFPRLPGGNTNLPVIMVAERAADFIRRGE